MGMTRKDRLLTEAIRELDLIRKTLNVGLYELTIEDLKQVCSCAISANRLVKKVLSNHNESNK
jgi:hypothetical protein